MRSLPSDRSLSRHYAGLDGEVKLSGELVNWLIQDLQFKR
jgi:hypothetical protein